jgi:DNA-binding CsgD family transcriptional regulator
VATYRSRLMAKLDVHDVPALVRLAVRLGLIDPDVR